MENDTNTSSIEEELQKIQDKLNALQSQNELLVATIYRISLATPSNLDEMLVRIDRIIKNIELKIKRG